MFETLMVTKASVTTIDYLLVFETIFRLILPHVSYNAVASSIYLWQHC